MPVHCCWTLSWGQRQRAIVLLFQPEDPKSERQRSPTSKRSPHGTFREHDLPPDREQSLTKNGGLEIPPSIGRLSAALTAPRSPSANGRCLFRDRPGRRSPRRLPAAPCE